MTTEIRILQIIEEIALRPVSLDDLLLDSNLIDSISAVDLALRMEDEFNCTIPAPEVTEHMKTARTLLAYVLKQR